MIIENQAMVTEAVVEAVNRTEDPRLRQILLALVRHLHGFVREVSLSEREFQEAVKILGIYWLMMNQAPPERPMP